jgi:hypothetical protein
MLLKAKLYEKLPKLSWCLNYIIKSNNATLLHGSWVEIVNNCFFEGAWNGKFNLLDFDKKYFLGTGGKIESDKIILSTSNHTLDRILLIEKEGKIIASNSLPFILEQAKEELMNDFIFYDSIFASIRYGLKKYAKKIPLKSNNHVNLFYCCNIVINNKAKIFEIKKNSGPELNSYTEIINYLKKNIDRISLNANDKMRKVIYNPLSTISSGYDSAASAALAKKSIIPCNEAITFERGRGGTNDSGENIGKFLKIKVKNYNRFSYLNRKDFPEAENSGGPTPFSSCSEELQGRLFYTGFQGDGVWDRNIQNPDNNILRLDSTGASLTELRLRTGFVHFPIPFLLSGSIRSVNKVSKSKEMKEWSMFNSYDRPIPRRILEESGVPREFVGVKKRNVGVYVTKEGLENTLSKESFNDFIRFLKKNWNPKMNLIVYLYKIVSKIRKINESVNKRVHVKIFNKLKINCKLPIIMPKKLEILSCGYIGKHSLLFQWGVEKIMKRYKIE